MFKKRKRKRFKEEIWIPAPAHKTRYERRCETKGGTSSVGGRRGGGHQVKDVHNKLIRAGEKKMVKKNRWIFLASKHYLGPRSATVPLGVFSYFFPLSSTVWINTCIFAERVASFASIFSSPLF